MKLTLLLLTTLAPALPQTMPRVSQLRNPQQVRVGVTDTRAGTHVNVAQVNVGRCVCTPTWLDGPENGLPTICVWDYYGYRDNNGAFTVAQSLSAYTALGRALLFAQSPEWEAWWVAHQNETACVIK